MVWYYVLNNERKGPVEQPEFEHLVREGSISGTTLVWRDGMPEWRPYSEVTASAAVAAPPDAASGRILCSECGQTFGADQVIRLGDRLVCAACKPIVTQKLIEGVGHAGNAEQIRKDHIKHEASVKSIGVLYFLGASLLILASVIAWLPNSKSSASEAIVASVLLIGVGVLQIWVGTGLRRLKSWARIPSGILSGVGLLAIPLGTLINAYILYLLFSKKGKMVFSDDYKAIILQTPHIKYRTSIIVWVLLGILLLLIGAGFIAAIFSSHR